MRTAKDASRGYKTGKKKWTTKKRPFMEFAWGEAYPGTQSISGIDFLAQSGNDRHERAGSVNFTANNKSRTRLAVIMSNEDSAATTCGRHQT